MIRLLPRMSALEAEQEVQRFLANEPGMSYTFNPHDLPENVRFAATGGTPVSGTDLAALRDGLLVIARKNGFGASATRENFAAFDADGAAWLAQSTLLDSGEALRDETWNFVGAVLGPDIVFWRFGDAMARYIGGPRNAFQRLWTRGRALDRGEGSSDRWHLLEMLSEDALVQITERPSIGGDPVLANAIAEAWVRAARHHGRSAMEDIMRRAILRIRIRNEIEFLSLLEKASLEACLDEVFGVTQAQDALAARDPEDQRGVAASDEASPSPEVERPRKRRWAIWRAR